MSGATDLIGLIDLSLGEKPSGVVNFNYLHSLLHEIVRRLGIFEEHQVIFSGRSGPLSAINLQHVDSSKLIRGSSSNVPLHGPSDVSLPAGVTGTGVESADNSPHHSSSVATPSHHTIPATTSISSSTAATTGTAQPSTVPHDGTSSSVTAMTHTSSLPTAAALSSSSVHPVSQSPSMPSTAGQIPSTTGGQVPTTAGGQVPTTTGGQVPTTAGGQVPTTAGGQVPATAGGQAPTTAGGQVPTTAGGQVPTATGGQVPTAAGGQVPAAFSGEERVWDRSGQTSSSDIHGRPQSTVDIHRPSSRVRHRKSSSVVSAANDLGYLERKLQELEMRVNTMESLPELLERKGSDINSTPVRDMWNFTNLNNRVGSVETGIDKNSRLMDEILGEVQGLKQQLNGVKDNFEKRLNGIDSLLSESANDNSRMEEKLKQLEMLKTAASSDSPSDAFMGILGGLQEKVEILQSESNSTMERINGLDFVSSSEFLAQKDSFKEFSDNTETKLTTLEGKLEANEYTTEENMRTVSASVEKLTDQVNGLESAMSEKVNAADLSSLLPTSDGGGDQDLAATLLPKLVGLQTKVNQLEEKLNEQPAVPSDLTDKITGMQNAIDHLSTEVSKLSGSGGGGVDVSRVDELGAQIAQMRERMEETDRALSALTNAVSEQGGVTVQEDVKDYVGAESFKGLQEVVQSLQEGQERLLGTAANISHELEVNQEHVKALYSAVDELRASKVDKDQLAMEVEEKADRSALDGKASREWVDSTFERLDREIREAKSHLLGQEEAFRNAVGQLNEDVEGKLDRMELEPLRDYIDKNLRRLKTAPITTDRADNTLTDDAAGFRKPLRFRCISCDKPLGMKTTDPIPTLPVTDNLPPTRSFRPYTTYELELIRRHQRIQPGVLGPPVFPMSIRSAGGSHTLTRPQQKIRVTPYTGAVIDNTTRSTPSVFVHDEMDIIGQDGHIYKGRVVKQGLPPISKRKYGGRNRGTKIVRPSSTAPLQSVQS